MSAYLRSSSSHSLLTVSGSPRLKAISILRSSDWRRTPAFSAACVSAFMNAYLENLIGLFRRMFGSDPTCGLFDLVCTATSSAVRTAIRTLDQRDNHGSRFLG